MFDSILNAFRAPDIRRRILFVLGVLIIFRAFAHVPVPGADPTKLAAFFNNNALFGLLDLFSGGGLSRFSVVGLGVNPYINASIIMQLMTGVIPALTALQREGEYGRNKINQYTRYLSVPLALLQSYGFLAVLNQAGVLNTRFDLASFETLTQIVTLTAGSILLMWLGELITEKGIGNGISFIIFAGIVGRAPQAHRHASWTRRTSRPLVVFAIFGVAAIAAIVFVTEGQRRIPIQYASRVRGRRMYQGGTTFLPLRVNQAGVIPIIFAVSILLFPSQIAGYFAQSQVSRRQGHRDVLREHLRADRTCSSTGRSTSSSPSASRTSTRRSRSSRTRRRSSCARTAASSRGSVRGGRPRTTWPAWSTGSRSPGRSSWASWRSRRSCSRRSSPAWPASPSAAPAS